MARWELYVLTVIGAECPQTLTGLRRTSASRAEWDATTNKSDLISSTIISYETCTLLERSLS